MMLPSQEDPYLATLDASVVDVGPDGREVVLDRTPLHPEGGGQPSDAGTVAGIEVVGLSARDDGAVVHRLAAPIGVPIGGRVTVEVDWPRRYDLMQQHTAQHLLTATAIARLGWHTIAFHLGPDRCDVEMDRDSLAEADLAALEEAVNAHVRAARPVRVRTAAREDLAALGVRSRRLPEGLTGPLRLVEIEGVDLNTCGGTHVASTAEVQAVKLLGTGKLARGTRLFFAAGGRVLRECDRALERDRALTRVLTCGREEHVGSVERLAADRRDLERAVKALRAERAERSGRDLASSAASMPSPAVAWHSDDADAEGLRAVAFAAREARPDLLVLATGGGDREGLVLLAGPEDRVQAAWRDVAPLLEARGGGRGGVVQGRAARLDRRAEAAARLAPPLPPARAPGADPADLEFDPDRMRAMLEAVGGRVVDHVASLADQPACGDTDVDDEARAMREPPPEAGADLEPLLDAYFGRFLPHTWNSAGPGYLAYIPGGGVFTAALADLIADATNRYTGMWRPSPMLVQLEANVLEWFREWMGFPAGTAGLLTTGGSMAGFNAIACARERLLGPAVRDGTMYVSSQAHHSIAKSARLAGVLPDRVRTVPVDGRRRMLPDALEDAIRRDRAAGLVPFLAVSTAGTTNTGAVDPLEAVADVCAREGLWHHVDGAYGAFFHVCPELRPLLAGLPRADSLALDPHKGLFLPYGTGALLVRDGDALRALHASEALYLPGAPAADLYDPTRHGPDLTRGFPGLRVWLTVKVFGTARIRAAIREKRDLAVECADRLAGAPNV
ncbi:MAG: aminotransferase class V-fold PLP-dependent enzyme, partial [Deltaproteobacteria bacterium]|nr:aminotransferase class V-fold PLP-dependent enzyme [Deltaproteobacteria bacterium]